MHIYLSYRIEDSFSISEQFKIQMVERFGEHRLLMNAAKRVYAGSTRAGQISDSVRGCHMMFVLIGPEWAIDAQTGENRFDIRDDSVRLEIETALRYNVPIVPVLVKGAQMPLSRSVPKSLHDLYTYSPHYISPAYLESDIDNLLNQYTNRSVKVDITRFFNLNWLRRVMGAIQRFLSFIAEGFRQITGYRLNLKYLMVVVLGLIVLLFVGQIVSTLTESPRSQLQLTTQLAIIDTNTVKNIAPLGFLTGDVKDFAFDPKGGELAIINRASEATLWDYVTGKMTFIGSPYLHLVFHPNRSSLFLLPNSGTLQVYEINTELAEPAYNGEVVNQVFIINPVGSRIATWDEQIITVLAEGSKTILNRVPITGDVLTIAFDKESPTMLWILSSVGLYLWDTGAPDATLLEEMLVCNGCTPRDMVVDTENGVVYYLYDDAGQSKIATVSQQNGIEAVINEPLDAQYINLSWDGSLIVAGNASQMVFWTTTDWQVSAIVSSDGDPIVDVQFSPQGDLLGVLDSNGMLTLWGVED